MKAMEYRVAWLSGDACIDKQATIKALRELMKKIWLSEVQNAKRIS